MKYISIYILYLVVSGCMKMAYSMPVPANEIEKTFQYIFDNQTKEVIRERDSAERK